MSAKKQMNVIPLERKKTAALKTLRRMFKLPALSSVIQRGSSDSTYELKFEDGKFIVLGSSLEVHQQSKVRARLFDAHVRMPKYDAKEWDEVLDALCAAAEEVETFTEAEELKNYVFGYVRTHLSSAVIDADDAEELLKKLQERQTRYKGFIDIRDKVVYLPLGKFVDFVNSARGGRMSERDVANMLSRHDFKYRQKGVRYIGESNESRTLNGGRFWISPDGYVADLFDESKK
jgi:hypothetical protein